MKSRTFDCISHYMDRVSDLDNEPTVTLNYDTQHFQQQAFIITGVKLFLLKHMSMKKAFSIDSKLLNLLITAAFTLF